MSDEFDLNLVDNISEEECRMISEALTQIQLEDNNTACETPVELPITTPSQQIPVLTTPRSHGRDARPHLYLSQPYSTETYRNKIRSRALLQNPTLVYDSAAFEENKPRTPSRQAKRFNRNRVRSYSTGAANESAWFSYHQRSYHNNPLHEQHRPEQYRHRRNSSASTSTHQVLNTSRQANLSNLPPYHDYPHQFVQGLVPQCHNYCSPVPPPSSFQFTNIPAHNTDHFPFLPYDSALPSQNAQLPQSVLQNISASPNVAGDRDFPQFLHNNLSAEQHLQFPYNLPSYNESVAQNPLSTYSSQNLINRVLNDQIELNYWSTTSGEQNFPFKFEQDTFQSGLNSSRIANNTFQFPYDPSLANQNIQAPEFPFQNSSASPNHVAQLPYYGFQNNSAITNKPRTVEKCNFQFKPPLVPYDIGSSSKTEWTGFCEFSLNNTLSADHKVQFQSSQCPYEPEYASQSAQHFPNTDEPPINRGRFKCFPKNQERFNYFSPDQS